MNPRAPFSRIKVHHVISFVAAITIVLSVILIATTANRGATAANTSDMVFPEPVKELPPEWQWEQPGVEYEHMYMSGRKHSKGLGWIRESGR